MAKTAPTRGAPALRTEPFPEPVSRLASIRMSLRLVAPTGYGPSDDDRGDDEALARAWNAAGEDSRARFDKRSGELVTTASEGMETLMACVAAGHVPNEEASRELADQIRRELAEISGIVLN